MLVRKQVGKCLVLISIIRSRPTKKKILQIFFLNFKNANYCKRSLVLLLISPELSL